MRTVGAVSSVTAVRFDLPAVADLYTVGLDEDGTAGASTSSRATCTGPGRGLTARSPVATMGLNGAVDEHLIGKNLDVATPFATRRRCVVAAGNGSPLASSFGSVSIG